jgi:hypothetical protein
MREFRRLLAARSVAYAAFLGLTAGTAVATTGLFIAWLAAGRPRGLLDLQYAVTWALLGALEISAWVLRRLQAAIAAKRTALATLQGVEAAEFLVQSLSAMEEGATLMDALTLIEASIYRLSPRDQTRAVDFASSRLPGIGRSIWVEPQTAGRMVGLLAKLREGTRDEATRPSAMRLGARTGDA